MVELVHGLHPRSPEVVKLVHRLHQASPRVVELEIGLHHGCLGGDHGCSGVVKLVMGLHHGSPMVVKLEIGLHQGCYIREHEVSQGGEANDVASLPKVQEGEVHEGTSPWEFQLPRRVRLVLEPHHMDSHTHVSR